MYLWQTSSSPGTCGSGCPPAVDPCLTGMPQSPQTAPAGWAVAREAPPDTASWHTACLSLRGGEVTCFTRTIHRPRAQTLQNRNGTHINVLRLPSARGHRPRSCPLKLLFTQIILTQLHTSREQESTQSRNVPVWSN